MNSKRVEELERLLETGKIEQVLVSYCNYVDLARPESVGALFTKDCRFDYGHSRIFEGRSALVELLTDRLATYANTSHHLTNLEVNFDSPTEAQACSYVYAYHRVANSNEVLHVWGRYEDHLIRTLEGWRIQERRIRVAGSEGFSTPENLDTPFEHFKRESLHQPN